jgi:hypothetical protein
MPLAHINKQMHKPNVHALRREEILLQTPSVRKAHLTGAKVFMVHKFPVSECPALFN